MLEYWPAVVLGWPSAICGLILLIWGAASRNAWLSAAGALVSLGFCCYMAMNPFPFSLWALFAVAFNVASVVAARLRARVLSLGLTLPFVLLSAYVFNRVFLS
jgi:hypothetical protein